MLAAAALATFLKCEQPAAAGVAGIAIACGYARSKMKCRSRLTGSCFARRRQTGMRFAETQPQPAKSQPLLFCSSQFKASVTLVLWQTSPGGGTR